MVLLFYITYINVDLAHHKIFRAKVGKGGIKGGRHRFTGETQFHQSTSKIPFKWRFICPLAKRH